MRKEWAGRNPQKDELRQQIWSMLKRNDIAVEDPFHEIPNYRGAEQAASRLRELDFWKRARVVKCNPDNAQIPLRRMALEDGKVLYMAVPQLIDESCFIELTLDSLAKMGKSSADAAKWEDALQYGKAISFERMERIDLAIVGCVAVTLEGARIGKGGGFADLEFGLLRHYGLIHEGTVIATTVHDSVIVEKEKIPLQKHDSFLNYIVTPTTVHQIRNGQKQPQGIHWDLIQEDQMRDIPILRKLKAEVGRRSAHE